MKNNFIIGLLIRRLGLSLQHNKEYFIIKKTKNIELILKILFKENFIKTYFNYKNNFIVFLKYQPKSFSILKSIKVVSTPGNKYFVNFKKLSSIIHQNPLSFFIISTSYGIIGSREAIRLNVGGELLFKINI